MKIKLWHVLFLISGLLIGSNLYLPGAMVFVLGMFMVITEPPDDGAAA